MGNLVSNCKQCVGDRNNDGVVDGKDLAILLKEVLQEAINGISTVGDALDTVDHVLDVLGDNGVDVKKVKKELAKIKQGTDVAEEIGERISEKMLTTGFDATRKNAPNLVEMANSSEDSPSIGTRERVAL